LEEHGNTGWLPTGRGNAGRGFWDYKEGIKKVERGGEKLALKSMGTMEHTTSCGGRQRGPARKRTQVKTVLVD